MATTRNKRAKASPPVEVKPVEAPQAEEVKEAPKSVEKKVEAPKEAKTSPKINNLKVGDFVQMSIFCGIRGKTQIIDITNDIVTVEINNVKYSTKSANAKLFKE